MTGRSQLSRRFGMQLPPTAWRVMRFLAIVWGVALSFHLLTGSLVALFSWFLQSSDRCDLVLANVPTQCTNGTHEAAQRKLDPMTARVLSWQLGLSLGVSAGQRQVGSLDAELLAQAQAERARIARELAIPTPELPPVVSKVQIMTEYRHYLAADPECVSSALSQAYSPGHGTLYRFAATVGHVWEMRSHAPQLGPVFVPELRCYGRDAGLAEPLWQDLTADFEGQSRELVRERLNQSVQALANAVAH
jgi:hypothetical protein